MNGMVVRGTTVFKRVIEGRSCCCCPSLTIAMTTGAVPSVAARSKRSKRKVCSKSGKPQSSGAKWGWFLKMLPKALREGGATPKWVPVDTHTPLLKGDAPLGTRMPPEASAPHVPDVQRPAGNSQRFSSELRGGAFLRRAFFLGSLESVRYFSQKAKKAKPAVVWAKSGFHPAFEALKYARHTTLEHSFAPFTMHQRRGRPRPRLLICTELQFQLFPASLMLPHAAAAALQSDSLEC